jgi:hypothetical protein
MPVRDRQAVRLRIRVPEKAPERRTEQYLWTAMRSLRRFSVAELLFAASTDDKAINLKKARAYLERLRFVGIVTSHRNAADRTESWFLKPGANTGPKPPRIIQLTMVWDDNARCPIGEKIISEEQA